MVDFPFFRFVPLATRFPTAMTRSPTFVLPEEVFLPVVVYGGSAFICRPKRTPGEILKIPIRLNTTRCSPNVREEAEAEEAFSQLCIERENT
jgi:hypothetical protein